MKTRVADPNPSSDQDPDPYFLRKDHILISTRSDQPNLKSCDDRAFISICIRHRPKVVISIEISISKSLGLIF